VFVKQFNQDQLELWARLRTTPSRYQDNTCTFNDVYCVDGTIIKGDIDLLEPDRGASRRFCTWANVNWALDTFGKSLRCNEFYHEALLSYAVRTELHDLPMFSRAELMEVNARRRTLTFKNVGGHDFDTLIHRMSASELHSTIAQVLVGIRMAQHRLSLKHHDLHLGNVMVSPRTEQASMILDTPEGMLRIPLVGYDATIIDFGLSSISKNDEALIRLDIDLLIMGNSASSSQKSVLPQDLGKSWGTWEPELKNDTGYDFAMFVESVTDTVVRERPLNLDKIKLLVKLGELISTPFTDRNRPENPSLVDWGKVWVALELNP
jgi:tRNA A-37 threonylcarbamoyl transferase component Bud32